MSSVDKISEAVDGTTLVNAQLLNSYREAILRLEDGVEPVPRIASLAWQSAHQFRVGLWVSRLDDGRWTVAQADTEENARHLVGVVSRVLTGELFEVTYGGHVSGLQGNMMLGPNYLSPSRPGEVQTGKPPTGVPVVPCIIADGPSSGYVIVGSVDPNQPSGPGLPPTASSGLMACNNQSAWARFPVDGPDGAALVCDHTSPWAMSWQTLNPLPGGAVKGDLMGHDGSVWGVVHAGADGQVLIADSGQGFGHRWGAISSLATGDQRAAYAALTTDADRLAYLAAYLGLVASP